MDTDNQIKSALASLIAEQGDNNLTPTMVLKRAGVSAIATYPKENVIVVSVKGNFKKVRKVYEYADGYGLAHINNSTFRVEYRDGRDYWLAK